jgi:hypothetical protein
MSDWAEEFDVVVFGFGGVEHHAAAGNASIVCDYRIGRLPRMPSHTGIIRPLEHLIVNPTSWYYSR